LFRRSKGNGFFSIFVLARQEEKQIKCPSPPLFLCKQIKEEKGKRERNVFIGQLFTDENSPFQSCLPNKRQLFDLLAYLLPAWT
jgi:hypothetical protein